MPDPGTVQALTDAIVPAPRWLPDGDAGGRVAAAIAPEYLVGNRPRRGRPALTAEDTQRARKAGSQSTS